MFCFVFINFDFFLFYCLFILLFFWKIFFIIIIFNYFSIKSFVYYLGFKLFFFFSFLGWIFFYREVLYCIKNSYKGIFLLGKCCVIYFFFYGIKIFSNGWCDYVVGGISICCKIVDFV